MAPYSSFNFNEERKWIRQNKLDDIMMVGIKKAIGYVSFYGKNKDLQKTILLQNKFQDKLTKIVSISNYDILWVGDKDMIQYIINNNYELIIKSGWSIAACEFFNRLTTEDICHDKNSQLYHVVCELFNSWCLWCEKPPIFITNNHV